MINMVGLLQFNVHAVSYSVSVSPNFISAGDFVTVSFINTGSLENEYRVGYSLGQYGDVTYLNGGAWSSNNLYTFVLPSVGRYWVFCYARDKDGSTVTYRIVDVSERTEESSEESLDESSDESSEEISLGLPFLPSDWYGNIYVQPSVESTPDLSYNELPSDLDTFEVSENFTQIIGKAFNSFPPKLIVLIIPTIICLFVGWWLHK